MNCLFCGSNQSKVIDKRAVSSSHQIRRRRECLKCHKRYTTYERLGEIELYVIKRDGRRELFDADKIRAGVEKSLEKRPGIERVAELVDKISRKLKAKGKREIDSKIIGQMVLIELKRVDKVAYLRFASVYQGWSGPEDFAKELQGLNT